jgi:hypothetical protein
MKTIPFRGSKLDVERITACQRSFPACPVGIKQIMILQKTDGENVNQSSPLTPSVIYEDLWGFVFNMLIVQARALPFALAADFAVLITRPAN